MLFRSQAFKTFSQIYKHKFRFVFLKTTHVFVMLPSTLIMIPQAIYNS